MLWFITGFTHIVDWKAYDHILFLFALYGGADWKEWKKIIVLITAFTIGHCATLALSAFDKLLVNSSIIEFLIPLTILFTGIFNLLNLHKTTHQNINLKYLMALFFGLIHGMGFSYLLKSLLGKTSSILMPLFSFNLGIEAGQIIILLGIFIISLFLAGFLKFNNKAKNLWISVFVIAISTLMAIERYDALLSN